MGDLLFVSFFFFRMFVVFPFYASLLFSYLLRVVFRPLVVSHSSASTFYYCLFVLFPGTFIESRKAQIPFTVSRHAVCALISHRDHSSVSTHACFLRQSRIGSPRDTLFCWLSYFFLHNLMFHRGRSPLRSRRELVAPHGYPLLELLLLLCGLRGDCWLGPISG